MNTLIWKLFTYSCPAERKIVNSMIFIFILLVNTYFNDLFQILTFIQGRKILLSMIYIFNPNNYTRERNHSFHNISNPDNYSREDILISMTFQILTIIQERKILVSKIF